MGEWTSRLADTPTMFERSRTKDTHPSLSPFFLSSILVFLVLSRVLLIVLVYPDQARMFNGDSALYEGLALHWLETGAYAYPPFHEFSDLFRPPGYPLFIAANYAVFGKGNFLLPILWNIVGVVFIFFGIRRLLALLGARAPHLVLGLFALDLGWLLYSKELVTEPIFTPLLLWSVVFFMHGMQAGGRASASFTDSGAMTTAGSATINQIKIPSWTGGGRGGGSKRWPFNALDESTTPPAGTPPAGTPPIQEGNFVFRGVDSRIFDLGVAALLLGVAALIKPIVLYLPLVLAPFLLVATKRVKPAMVFAGVFALVVAPWFVRNLVVHDTLSFTYVQNDNLLYAHAAFVLADAQDLTHGEAKDVIGEQLAVRVPSEQPTYADLNAAKGALARDILADHPLLYAKAIVRGTAVTLFDPGRLVFNRTFPSEAPEAIGLTNIVARDGVLGALKVLLQKDPMTVIVLSFYLLFLLCVTGLAVLGVVPFFKKEPRLFLLLTLVTAYLLVLGGPNGYARFRLYIFPFLLVYAHFGVVFLQTLKARRSPQTALPA